MEVTQYIEKKELFILGAGGLARELESWISQSKDFTDKYTLAGFLDDNAEALNGYVNQYKILGKLNEQDLENKTGLMAIANPLVKESLFGIIQRSKVTVISFRHHTAVTGNNNMIGEGLVMCPFSLISCNTELGDGVFINCGSQIGHDVRIGDYSSIMTNVDIGGGAIIGKNVFIGSNAVILPNIKIPDSCIIGAGSVVVKNIKESGTYFGSPAKKIF